ncbi:MAG: FAD-dependent oxidoreductase [Rheinheimera sp.]|uniref:glycerol-3-phosphate dehydrogenase/oxidase n=1 Tax=Arsukibacterium sp. UBA3155 TaxID=1946058 RepID=UPI000C96EC67|nr:glycerol-3-phosphate dehydrogenase/oxidase [Arsukibacterium sp. UBA3155]MAD73221.1 FAD-dependent oxidoreductase [Rheinheimera sp.]|tara:strand:- start:51528 stop:52592 length:1065 start_codon:yes stop_codon:yes gene_type:complete
MKLAIVGGGINGLSSAWQMALAGHQVTLFERDTLMAATSSASSKLLHGGLRYLEQGEFRLVREALQERRWWLKKAPQLTRRLPILYPIYDDSRRARWQLKIGLWLYDTFAGRKGIGRHRWLTASQALRCSAHLNADGLKGAYLFFDGQMDDQKLGLWMAAQCTKAGVQICEHAEVLQVDTDGRVLLHSGWQQFDRVINVAGPWSQQLLKQSGLAQQPLDLVRGSHLLLPAISRYGHMLEVPGETRIVFVLPYQGNTLLGTTEVRQQLTDPITCSEAERDYLLNVYNHYFQPKATHTNVLANFAGVRPLLGGSANASNASREYQLSWQGQLLTVSGGKWTTARALGKSVAMQIKP